MIFRTEKLQQLKSLEYECTNPEIISLIQNVLTDVWPQSPYRHFCQTIQSIALKWLDQFVILLEKWLTQASSKYSNKLLQFSLIKKSQDKHNICQYLTNLSKYIQSMEHPLIASINNIHSLYLKFPSDQLIQQPKRSLLNKSTSSESSPLKKKKSLSIQTFTSNLPTRSRSKSRKLSFFNTIKPNIFQTFSKENKKTNQTLNTTIKKVKKDLPFTKTSSTFHSYPNQHNQKQKYATTKGQHEDLRQQLQKRLMNSCSSTFLNQMVVQESFSREQSLRNNYPQVQASEKLQKGIKSSLEGDSGKRQLEQQVKRSILEQIERKDKQNYEHLLKEIENKLSNKFDNLLSGILKQKQSNEAKQISFNQMDVFKNVTNKTHSKEIIQNPIKTPANEEKYPKKGTNEDKILSTLSKTQKMGSDQIQQIINKQPSICNMLRYNKENYQPFYEASQIEEVKPVQIKKDPKVNTSVIVQKDSSKIIKSKSRNSSIVKETKQQDTPKENTQKSHVKSSPKPKGYNNPLDYDNSIDSIQIYDSPINSTVFLNSKPVQTRNIQSQSTNPKTSQNHQSQSKKPKTSQNHKHDTNLEQQDNFFTKRIKQVKNKMQKSIKTYKISCDKLILPVNQTFMLIFSSSYQQFCQLNSLPVNSQEVTETFAKYKLKAEITSKKPQNQEKFLMDSLLKIQKMVNLNCPREKKLKILEYTEKCIQCIQNVFFEKPDLKLNDEAQLTKKIKEIKVCLANLNNK